MEIRISQHQDINIVEPAGSLDTRNALEFEKKIGELLDLGVRLFVVDFSNTAHLTSSGLRVLLMLAKKLPSMDGKLVLCSLNDHVKTVFDISGFTDFFPITSSQREAVAHLSSDTKLSKISQRAMKLLGRSEGSSISGGLGKGAGRKEGSQLSAHVAKLLSGSGGAPVSKSGSKTKDAEGAKEPPRPDSKPDERQKARPSDGPQKGDPTGLGRMKDWIKGKR